MSTTSLVILTGQYVFVLLPCYHVQNKPSTCQSTSAGMPDANQL